MPEGAKDVRIWFPLPRKEAEQDVSDLQVEAPAGWRETTDASGNSYVYVEAESPSGKLTVICREHTSEVQSKADGASVSCLEGNYVGVPLGGSASKPKPIDAEVESLFAQAVAATADDHDIEAFVEPIRPPAARAPEMIEPTKTAPKKTESKVRDDVKDPKSRTPTKGKEVEKGSAVAETFGRGQGFGLSSGGGGTGSYLDTANFCCPEYIALMIQQIHGNWDKRVEVPGLVTVQFTIQRDGRISDILLNRSSGYVANDLNAQRALARTRQLAPLPAQFPNTTLGVYLTFEYQR